MLSLSLQPGRQMPDVAVLEYERRMLRWRVGQLVIPKRCSEVVFYVCYSSEGACPLVIFRSKKWCCGYLPFWVFLVVFSASTFALAFTDILTECPYRIWQLAALVRALNLVETCCM